MACEEILLSEGRWREAYDRYALEANRQSTYLATFQAMTSKYPQIEPKAILGDLVDRTPGKRANGLSRRNQEGFSPKRQSLLGRALAIQRR